METPAQLTVSVNFGRNTTVFQGVIHTILLNTSFIDNFGLMDGKMGISIFIFHLTLHDRQKRIACSMEFKNHYLTLSCFTPKFVFKSIEKF